jgi:RND family efflux transporter MFP subunit
MRNRILVAAVIALAGCKRGGEEKESAAKLPPVTIAVAKARTIHPRIPIAGVLAPLPGKDVKVGALVSGRVDQVLVAEGDKVRIGQVLAHVEAQPLREHVTEIDAQKESASAALENARTRLARTEKLWRDGISARQEVDDAKAQLVAAESALKAAQATGGIAAVQLDRATLRAPIAGVVAAILVPAGQPVDGNGTPVIEVADASVLDVRAPIPAGSVGEIAIGQKSVLTVEGVGDVEGEVVAIAPLVDSATNTVMVRVRVPNGAGRLRGGMFARGAILAPERSGFAVPRTALLPGDGGAATTVAILDGEGKVAHRALALGVEAGVEVEVRSGLADGDRVIATGGYSLPDGVEVEIVAGDGGAR